MKNKLFLFLLISTYLVSTTASLNESNKFLDNSDKSNDLSKKTKKFLDKKGGEKKVSESNLLSIYQI